jgi:20S proteasome subunit beta 7
MHSKIERSVSSSFMEDPATEAPSIITSSSSIIAVKYDKGILLASDQVVSYGAGFQSAHVSHFHKLTPTTIVGCTGELGDFQSLVRTIIGIIDEDETRSGGRVPTPSEIHTYIARLLYQRRTKLKPLVVRIVLAGISPDGSLFLATSDLRGVSWEDSIITTGLAGSIKGLQLPRAVGGSRDAVQAAMNDVWYGLYTRHLLQRGPLEYFDVSADGIQKLDDVTINLNWSCIEATLGAANIV